jgi:hypothetical protein
MTTYTILHAKDFAEGTRNGYLKDTLAIADSILHDGYRVVGIVEAESFEDAYAKSQNGLAGWAAVPTRSTSVGDVIKLGPPGVGGEFQTVAPFGFAHIGEGATDAAIADAVQRVLS